MDLKERLRIWFRKFPVIPESPREMTLLEKVRDLARRRENNRGDFEREFERLRKQPEYARSYMRAPKGTCLEQAYAIHFDKLDADIVACQDKFIADEAAFEVEAATLLILQQQESSND